MICFDAAFNDENHSYATGYAIFDPGGTRAAFGFRKIKPTCTVLAAKIQVISNSLAVGLSLRLSPIRVFLDLLEAIHSLYSMKKYRGVEEAHIEKAKSLIQDPLVVGLVL